MIILTQEQTRRWDASGAASPVIQPLLKGWPHEDFIYARPFDGVQNISVLYTTV